MTILNETLYLKDLQESTVVTNTPISKDLIDFTMNEIYTGEESIADVLMIEGFQDIYIEEGILSMPINKMKSIVNNIASSSGNVADLHKTTKKFKGLAASVKPKDIKTKVHNIAAAKGIEKNAIDSMLEKFLRAFAAIGLVTQITQPLAWLILLICLMKAGSLQEFRRQTVDMLNELKASIEKNDTAFENAMSIQTKASRLLLLCLIPPWVHGIVLMPMACILSIISMIHFIQAIYDMYG